jgi:hypothetical protein
MKPVKICRSFQLPLVLTFVLVLPLFTASACAEDPTASRSSAAAGVSTSDPASKWVGVYDPFSRACSKDVLTIYESTFTWGDCKKAKIHVIAASDTELAFEVDSSTKCGWAGLIVALTTPSPDSRAVSVNAYRSLEKYQMRESVAFCAYSKRTN